MSTTPPGPPEPPGPGDLPPDPFTPEETAQVEAEWNPLRKLEPEWFPVEASKNAAGKPRAWVLLRKWSGRERLAYEDAITEKMLTKDTAGEETIRLGTLRLFACSLTIVGQKGFPTRVDGSALFSGERQRVQADLLDLEPDAYNEIRELALKVQPLPSENQEETAKKGDDDVDESALPDPSREPRTPPEANDGSESGPASPDAS
jgi:hypothetical protein